jgi:hypothetical protein
MKEAQYDEYDRDNEQNMEPIARAREICTDVLTEKAERP